MYKFYQCAKIHIFKRLEKNQKTNLGSAALLRKFWRSFRLAYCLSH